MQTGVDQKLIHDIQKQYLRMISQKIRAKKIALDAVRSSARELISHGSYSTEDDLRAKIAEFERKYPDFAGLSDLIEAHEDEQKKKLLVSKN
ncbi:MAG: hypothetical protein UZ21_OP11001000866 [Microgenomates bacterium OLB22]|nr:MAG: hypothetical protein UZ21_OP11001000866 [Microgenomates bacterium OLB22]